MSNIYYNSSIYCSSSVPFNISEIDKNFIFPQIDLYYCPECQSPRALYQTFFKVNYKFCSNCLTDFTKSQDQYTCSKNCFVCPECSSNLSISFENHDNNGKSFKFKCVYCEYKFKTSVIYKPQSLTNIINESKKDSFNKLCQDIRNGVLKSEKAEKLSDRTIKNLQLMNKNLTKEMEEPFTIEKYPLPSKLTTKKIVYCLDCKSTLFAPLVENIPPTTNKVLTSFVAIDYLPHISTTKLTENIYLLHFINPLEVKVHFQILISNSDSCTVDITTTDFVLGPKISNLIKTIPIAYLTHSTTQSKSELILRKGGKMYQEATEDNMDDYFEKGANWISIPFAINTESRNIDLPMHVKLRCDNSPQVQLNKISTNYWCVLAIN
ncbi:hypothetical protein KGF54_000252 [Candida jiufengensis]|uniref:uncharacterized protein n=1 Tax=Candida jiufengensis TaxID=497108 RepID=UPI00222459E8|nr:uncharacterized protein KGF54_000252 [Candida jiufengensis]KAI5957324.1 hypothetical protein KGF54_000252 [Candida jiufengensis]